MNPNPPTLNPKLLLTPGPVAVPDFVLEAIAQPVIPHRSEAFYSFYGHLVNDLKYLFQTQQRTCCMVGTGTQGVEAAMYSLFRPGDRVVILSMGKFSERWVEYGQILGLEIEEIPIEWGRDLAAELWETKLKSLPNCAGVILTHCETSTGVGIDLESLASLTRQIHPEALVLVDAITSVGVIPFYFDAWGIDCAVVASQKALMNPAGLCAFAVSDRAYARTPLTPLADSRNLRNYLDSAASRSYPYTAPCQLLYGVQAALKHIKDTSLPTIWNHTQHLAQHFRERIHQIGGEVFSEHPAASLTAFGLPVHEVTKVKNILEEKYGILISGGQGHLKGKILRVSHMGRVNNFTFDTFFQALEDLGA